MANFIIKLHDYCSFLPSCYAAGGIKFEIKDEL